MECAWPLSPILMLFGSAIVVVLIKSSKTKLKGMEMELENKSSGFFILLPTLLLHLFFFFCFLFYSFSFPLYFLIFHPLSSPSLPSITFASTTLSLILSHPFHFLFKLFFLHNHQPIFVFGFIFPQTSVLSESLYLPIVRGWILSRFTLYLSREGSLFLSLTGSITNSENLFRNTHL